ncbi:hypothetical protein PO1_contig-051-26 [Mycobacterium sp. PO1]|nr:hypothetical protein PO1_contig-051-26 [Mycobacterium sp. PO1]GFM23012.1 hypothetical protein PO2_contig-021-47 [Mycobacterium sp. PO2]
MRVYVPVTLAMLQRLVADESVQPVSGTAFAVTPTLREAYAHGDEDELADVALRDAALASLRLLADDSHDTADSAGTADAAGPAGTMPTRRAVVEADADDVTLRPDLDDAVVRVRGPIPLTNVIAAYVDNAGAEPAVKAAVEVIDAADLGNEDAELTVGDAQDHDLAWYAPQELPFLLELL